MRRESTDCNDCSLLVKEVKRRGELVRRIFFVVLFFCQRLRGSRTGERF